MSEQGQPENQRKTRRSNYFDYSLLFVIIFLVCFGFLMLYSASAYSALAKTGDSTHFLKKQIFASFLGFICMAFFTFFDYRQLQKFVMPLYIISIVMVFMVYTPLGLELNGARRWLSVGPISIQPAEVVKLSVILITAAIISKNAKNMRNWKVMVRVLLYALIGAGLIGIVTKNLSSAIIVLGISVVMIFVASPNYAPFIGIGLIGIAGIAAVLGIGVLTGAAFRISRFMVWIEPEAYASTGGYQVLQGLYAIGSGGIFGKGLGNSVQKLGFIPEAQNDMIFTIICEELGLIGALAVIVLFVFIVRRMVVIASNAPDLFGSMLVVGVLAQISIQVILNIAVVTNSMPNTGITLPLISYGGTSVLFLMSELGMVMSVSRRIRRVK